MNGAFISASCFFRHSCFVICQCFVLCASQHLQPAHLPPRSRSRDSFCWDRGIRYLFPASLRPVESVRCHPRSVSPVFEPVSKSHLLSSPEVTPQRQTGTSRPRDPPTRKQPSHDRCPTRHLRPRGRPRSIPRSVSGRACAGRAAGGVGMGRGSGRRAQAPPDAMSNRAFLQNGQQASPGNNNGAGKKNSMTLPNAAEEDRRIGDLIAKRQAEQEGEFISEILVEGNATIPTPAILQKVKVAPGRKASVKSIQDDVRALLENGLVLHRRNPIPSAQTREGAGAGLRRLRAAHRPQRGVRRQPGDRRPRSSKRPPVSRSAVPSTPAPTSRRPRKSRASTGNRAIRRPTVDLEKGGKRDDRDVLFRIHEGVKQKIMLRDFEGNQAFSSELLSLQFVSTPASAASSAASSIRPSSPRTVPRSASITRTWATSTPRSRPRSCTQPTTSGSSFCSTCRRGRITGFDKST